jgi:hypothetical protein
MSIVTLDYYNISNTITEFSLNFNFIFAFNNARKHSRYAYYLLTYYIVFTLEYLPIRTYINKRNVSYSKEDGRPHIISHSRW